jgi:hypothetical protein
VELLQQSVLPSRSIVFVDGGGSSTPVGSFTGSKIAGNVDLGPAKNARLILDGAGEATLSLAVTGTVTNNGFLIKQGIGTSIGDP